MRYLTSGFDQTKIYAGSTTEVACAYKYRYVYVQQWTIISGTDRRLVTFQLDECTDYEQRRRLRARIRSLMAEQEGRSLIYTYRYNIILIIV